MSRPRRQPPVDFLLEPATGPGRVPGFGKGSLAKLGPHKLADLIDGIAEGEYDEPVDGDDGASDVRPDGNGACRDHDADEDG